MVQYCYTISKEHKELAMGAFNMVIAVVSPDVLTHLKNLGCPDHNFFMQWLQTDTGVTSTQITDSVYQLQGNWQVVSKVNDMLNKLLTAHKAENMEELCRWLKCTDEGVTEPQMGPQKSEVPDDPSDIAPGLPTKDVETKGTQTDYFSGMTVTEEMMHAIQEGYTNIIKNATQAAVQSSPTISSPNFAPQINIFTGEKSRKGRGRPRGRPPTKAKLKEPPAFSTAASIGEVTVKKEPMEFESDQDQDDGFDPGGYDDDSMDEDYKPKAKHRRKSTPVQKIKSEPNRNAADSSYREKVITHVSQQNDQERNSRIEAFIMIIEPGMKDFDDGYRFGCNSCDFRARLRDAVREHIQRIHIPAADYSCMLCGKKYNVMRDLKRHIRNHEVKHVCEICGKRYRERRNLELHMRKHQDSYDPKPYGCDECDQSFCNQYVLKKHVDSVHRGIKEEHVCVECGKVFTQKHSLQEHAALHLETRPHVCDVCGASFTYKSSLRSHRKTQHTECEERKFICEICSKAFKTRGSLEKHKVTHDLEKRIPCPRCGKLFTQTSAVTRHMVTHTGEKNHKCSICGQGFNDPSILRRHYSGVHKVEMPRKKAGRPLPPGAQGIAFPQTIVDSSSQVSQPQQGASNSELSALALEGADASKLPAITPEGSSEGNLNQQFQQQSHSVSEPQSPDVRKQLFQQQQQQNQPQSMGSRLPPLTTGTGQHLQQHFQQQQTQSVSEPPSPYQQQHQTPLNSPTLHSPPPHSEPGTLPNNQQSETTAQQQSEKQLQQSELQRQQQLLLQQVTTSNLFRQSQFPGSFY